MLCSYEKTRYPDSIETLSKFANFHVNEYTYDRHLYAILRIPWLIQLQVMNLEKIS